MLVLMVLQRVGLYDFMVFTFIFIIVKWGFTCVYSLKLFVSHLKYYLLVEI